LAALNMLTVTPTPWGKWLGTGGGHRE